MADKFIARETKGGLTLTLYRGEDMTLLAFDIDETLRKPDFVGFGIQYRIGNSAEVRDVYNFLTFQKLRVQAKADAAAAGTDQTKKAAAKKKASDNLKSIRSPLQTFRWAHVPSVPLDGPVTYRLSAMFWNGDQPPVARATVEATIDTHRITRDGFLNIGFTRGFASSQAYSRRFGNTPDILPGKNQDEIDFDTSRFDGVDADGQQRPYPWLGFEARKILFDFMDELAADPDVSVDVFAYDLSDPEIVRRLEAFRTRLRIVIDDSDKHGKTTSDETAAEKRLKQSAGAANVVRHHFTSSGLQHNKVIIAKRRSNGGLSPFAVLTGSTNFSLGGLYIQNNNALLFRDAGIAKLYANVFAAAFPSPAGFSGKPEAADWFPVDVPNAGSYRFCFSPHKKAEISLRPLADAIDGAKKSVFYAIAFRSLMGGAAAKALDKLDPEKLLVMGVANMAGKPNAKTLMVQLPGRGPKAIGPAALEKDLPEPFKAEWKGGGGIHMHHKFVVCDFNGEKPVVFTGSSNLAGAENANGDNLIEIRDPKVVVAYAVQAVSIFDHYAYRNRMKNAEKKPAARDLAEPPAAGKPAWWEPSFQEGEAKCRDRELFSS